jgi:hypothetical protein
MPRSQWGHMCAASHAMAFCIQQHLRCRRGFPAGPWYKARLTSEATPFDLLDCFVPLAALGARNDDSNRSAPALIPRLCTSVTMCSSHRKSAKALRPHPHHRPLSANAPSGSVAAIASKASGLVAMRIVRGVSTPGGDPSPPRLPLGRCQQALGLTGPCPTIRAARGLGHRLRTKLDDGEVRLRRRIRVKNLGSPAERFQGTPVAGVAPASTLPAVFHHRRARFGSRHVELFRESRSRTQRIFRWGVCSASASAISVLFRRERGVS